MYTPTLSQYRRIEMKQSAIVVTRREDKSWVVQTIGFGSKIRFWLKDQVLVCDGVGTWGSGEYRYVVRHRNVMHVLNSCMYVVECGDDHVPSLSTNETRPGLCPFLLS